MGLRATINQKGKTMSKAKKGFSTGLPEPIEHAVWFRLYSLGMHLCNDPRVAVIVCRDRKSYVRGTVEEIREVRAALPQKKRTIDWALRAVKSGVRQYKADEKRRRASES